MATQLEHDAGSDTAPGGSGGSASGQGLVSATVPARTALNAASTHLPEAQEDAKALRKQKSTAMRELSARRREEKAKEKEESMSQLFNPIQKRYSRFF